MELKQYVKLIIILALALSPALVFGYSNTKTHPMLTGEAIKLFEADGQISFSDSEKQKIIQGSINEDDVPRWLEHFYDPVNNRGFNEGQFSTSKKWAHGQAITGNNYSWENAIYEYAYGDKSAGLYALGHIMHLVQDATVPDHTRDDPHPLVKTYETYASEQTSVSLSSLVYLDSLDAYFDQLANFSNFNFFSDDTVLKHYMNPKILKTISEKDINGTISNYGYNNYGRIVRVRNWWGNDAVSHTEYSLKDTDNKVMSDYWNTLAPKAVGYSAGVIKLFLAEIEKEKETGTLKKERLPWWEKLLEVVKIKTDQLLASVNLSIKETEGLLPLAPPPPLPEALKEEEPELSNPELEKGKTAYEQLLEIREKLEKLKAVLNGLQGESETVIIPIISSANKVFASLGTPTVNLEAPTTTIVTILPPIIISPTDFSSAFATTSITFSGTASSGLIIYDDFVGGQATTSESGEWTLAINNLPQGSSTIKFFARDNEGNVSLPTEITLSVEALPLAINLTISNCANSLASDFCLLKPTSTLNFVWEPTKPGDYKYDLIKTENDYGDWLDPETAESGLSALGTSANPALGAKDLIREFKWQVLARDALSNEVVASSGEIVTTFHPRPIVINEIGWAGTAASNLDEWLELQNFLYHRSVNLDDYYLTDADQTWSIDLSGNIQGENYYLIERGSDEVISNRPADLVVDFISDSSAKAFNLGHLGLKLWHKNSLGDELVDETPVWNKEGAEASSLERTFENTISTNLSSWKNNYNCDPLYESCALDRSATTTFGTPGEMNVASVPSIW